SFPNNKWRFLEVNGTKKGKVWQKIIGQREEGSVDRNIAFMTDLYHLGVDVASFMAPGRQRKESEVVEVQFQAVGERGHL
ncbi:hypothetical protein KUCAC02_002854, partial [Chaenocephalus aceratus]